MKIGAGLLGRLGELCGRARDAGPRGVRRERRAAVPRARPRPALEAAGLRVSTAWCCRRASRPRPRPCSATLYDRLYDLGVARARHRRGPGRRRDRRPRRLRRGDLPARPAPRPGADDPPRHGRRRRGRQGRGRLSTRARTTWARSTSPASWSKTRTPWRRCPSARCAAAGPRSSSTACSPAARHSL